MKIGNLYLIKWRDAAGISDNDTRSWFTKENCKEMAQQKWDEYVVSVGWFISDTKDFIVLASTKSFDLYSDVTMIPKSSIFKSKKLLE